jgi:hypothetical protein
MADYKIDTSPTDTSSFDCGHVSFNDYLRKHNDASVMHYIKESATDKLAGYFTLQAAALPYSWPGQTGAIPAIEMKMFAMDKHFHGSGASTSVLSSIIDLVAHYAHDFVGAKIILVYSVPVEGVLALYESNGFERLTGSTSPYPSTFADGCVPMFKVL